MGQQQQLDLAYRGISPLWSLSLPDYLLWSAIAGSAKAALSDIYSMYECLFLKRVFSTYVLPITKFLHFDPFTFSFSFSFSFDTSANFNFLYFDLSTHFWLFFNSSSMQYI